MEDERQALKIGDWLRCTLPKLSSIYGRYCRVVEIPATDKGVRVAFIPRKIDWKPYRTALDDSHWLREDPDTVTLLGDLTR